MYVASRDIAINHIIIITFSLRLLDGVKSDCDVLLFVTAQPSDAVQNLVTPKLEYFSIVLNLSLLLMIVNWSPSSGSLCLLVIVVFPLTCTTSVVMFKLLESTNLKCSEALPRCPYFQRMFAVIQNISYPFGNCWLTRAKSKFLKLYFVCCCHYKRRNCPFRSVANTIHTDIELFNGRRVLVSSWQMSDTTLVDNPETLRRSYITKIALLLFFERR